jgi:acyl-CoA thioesterase
MQERFDTIPWRAGLGATVEAWGPGWAEVRLEPQPRHANLNGNVHGGVLVALADLAFEVSCNGYGRMVVALGLTTHFTAAAPLARPLLAVADELSRSRSTAAYDIRVTSDETLVAHVSAMAYRTARWHLDEALLPDGWAAAH